jgi:tRNA U55 pseudouridine synthase TruB
MNQLDDLILPADYTVQYLPKLSLTDNESRMVCHGQSIKRKFHHNVSFFENKETIRLYDMHNTFLGLARLNEDKTILRPFKIMHYSTDGINTLGRKINV